MRTVESRSATIASLAAAYINAGSSRDKAFTLGFAPIIEDAINEKGVYIVEGPRRKGSKRVVKTRETTPLGALRVDVLKQGSEAGVALSRLIRIRKENRPLWKKYLRGVYAESVQLAYKALSQNVAPKKVRVPRALRALMNRLQAVAEKQNLRISFNLSRVK